MNDLAASIAAIPFAFVGGTKHLAVISKEAARRIRQVGRVSDGPPVLIAARDRIKERAEGRRLAAKNLRD